MKIRFVMWDWKERPDIKWLNRSLRDVFNGTTVPCITEVNTGDDSGAMVVSGETVDEEQAQGIFNRYMRLGDKENPLNRVLDIKWP